MSLLTVDEGSPLGQLAGRTGGNVVVLPAPTPKLDGEGAAGISSVQPMGSLFEQVRSLNSLPCPRPAACVSCDCTCLLSTIPCAPLSFLVTARDLCLSAFPSTRR